MSRNVSDADEADDEGAHLEEIPSGAGCTEIWEKLSEQREAASAAAAEADDADAE